MAEFAIKQRLSGLRARMTAEGVDAFLGLKSVTVEYLTGFDYVRDEEDPHAVLVTADAAYFVTDARYLEAAQAQIDGVAGAAGWQVTGSGEKWIPQELGEIWDFSGLSALALEDTVSQRFFATLSKVLTPATLRPVKNWVEDLRRVKDEAEIERIAAAQAITDETFTHMCGYLRTGLTEFEVAVELEYTLRKLGADGLAFPSIVASGPNGSLPHAVPGKRRIEAGDFVILDFGAASGGYCSDMTRTVCVGGRPTDEQGRVYQAVLDAQLADLAVIADGVTGLAADAAGRDLIKAAGYGDYFGHGTSHGVGLAIHESPNTSPRSRDTLRRGEVISCEPGIYLPGKLGVRIEDLVVVTEGGVRNLTSSPKELLIL